MAIAWKRSTALAGLLPRHHPATGLLERDASLHEAGAFAFSFDPPLPEPRRMAPEVLAALEARHRALGSPPAVFESLRLLGEGAPAVVTGQQAGLLGGPLFTLFKTLTAIRVARELSARHGRPFVPVFWSETEDHDHEEVNRAATLGAQGEPRSFSLAIGAEHAGRPVGAVPLGPDARRLVADFFAASPATEFSAALAAALTEDLDRSLDWGTWFSRHLDRLFGGCGLVVADSLDPQLAACARLLWARVLEEPLELTAICQERGRWLAGLGYRPILQKMEKRTPFFLIEEGRRAPVTYERGLFRTGGADYTLLALLKRLDERPGDFSAAVHLRPQLQDFLLPTAAYVAGPTEMAYFLQLLPGYRALGVPAPAIVHRASLTLVEPGVEKVLARYGVEPGELREGTDRVLTALVRREQRHAAPALWEKTREAALKPVQKLAESLAPEYPDLARRTEQVRGKIDFLLKELESRSIAELRRQSESAKEQLERARGRLFPGGGLQERLLSAYYFLGKYGPGLIGELLDTLPSDTSLHHFGTIVPAQRQEDP